jgi:hypothetical protein
MAPIFLAVEPRFKAAVLVVGGFYVQPSKPEVEAINFAPRVKFARPDAQRTLRFLSARGRPHRFPMFRLLVHA